jgi:glycosyltransferase involved in cell wall biosynthesis
VKFSIIIVAYNGWDYLDRCLDSIRSSHIEGYQIIAVNNSPGPLAPEHKAILEKADKIIHPPQNLGFAKGCNVGVMGAEGEYLIFLNPDTEVYGDWANRLAKHLETHPQAGAVGPISNFVAGGQNEIFHLGNQNPEEPQQTKLLIGFCLMIRRSVYDEMGGMDPLLFLGNDDLDLSWRLRLAGYMLLIAPDVFVYHAGHKSMETEPKPHIAQLLAQSQAHLKAKVQAHYGDATPSAIELWGVDFFQTREKGPLKLSVVMIVRDEDKNLETLIPQLGFADEVILVDTHPDHTCYPPEGVSPEPGRRWFGFPWCDDFAAARNFANSKATGDYILWLDADDRVPEESARLIRQGMDNPSERMLRKNCFFSLKLENTIDGKPHGETVYQARIVPNLPEIRWEGAVHESLVPSLQRLKLTAIHSADIRIVHTGYDTEDLRLAKANRNMGILRTMPDTPQKYWDMGNAYASCEQFEEAFGLYRLVLDRWEKHLTPANKPDAAYMRALCLEALGEPWRPVLEAYLAMPEHPDTYGTHRAYMVEEARRKLAG